MRNILNKLLTMCTIKIENYSCKLNYEIKSKSNLRKANVYKLMKIQRNFKYLLLLTIGLLSGCLSNEKTESKEKLKINLSLSYNNDTYFDYRSNQFLILTTKEVYPSYYKKKLESFSNKTVLNTSVIVTENTSGMLYSREIFFKERYKRTQDFHEKKSDKMLENLNRFEINALTRVENGKQIVILDENSNQDFSDDTVLTFKDNFRYSHNNNDSIIETLPVVGIKYDTEVNTIKYSFQRKVQIYPYSNFFYTQDIKDSLTKQTTLMLKFKDFWKGKLNFNDEIYDIGVQGMRKYPIIMIKPQDVNYKGNSRFNRNFEYHLKDTVSFDKDLYLIDSITPNRSKLILKKVKLEREYFGRRIGNQIKDFKLYNLKEESFKLSDVNLNNKKFTLIDVWGTWCLPCLKLTPELKRMSKEYSDEVSFLSVAKDDSIQKVKEYVSKNQMNWAHAYIDINKDYTFIKELKVISYPTFILINKKRKIVYRGSGESALKEIEKIIKK